MSCAEAKALGLLAGNAPGVDEYVGFLNTAPYTFDPNCRAVLKTDNLRNGVGLPHLIGDTSKPHVPKSHTKSWGKTRGKGGRSNWMMGEAQKTTHRRFSSTEGMEFIEVRRAEKGIEAAYPLREGLAIFREVGHGGGGYGVSDSI
jgi:hypothetical protein